MTTPQQYNLSHSQFRPHQLESIEWCLNNTGTLVVAAPTGSGKTAYAAATSSQKSVIVLCRTKNLQAENYGRLYNAEVLYGRGNYECIHPDNHGVMCDECIYADTSMHKCEFANGCKYLIAKARAKASPFASLNYWYFLTAQWPREEGACQYLFLDEAHQLSDIVLDFAGCTITEKQRVEWDLPEFPIIKGGGGWKLRGENPVEDAQDWLQKGRDRLARLYVTARQSWDSNLMKRVERLGGKISRCLDAIKTCPDDWFIRSGRSALKFGREERPGFVCKPLTARHHFPGYFLDGHTTVAMSATIGKPETFSEELGIRDYNYRAVPNQWPADKRQVHLLDVPSMGRSACKKEPRNFDYQADAIARAIKSCDPGWSGLIHVTRKIEARLLADRLARRGLQNRIWVMPGVDGNYVPTNEQVRRWKMRKRKVPNSICLSWSLWEGYDGLDEQIDIVAKVPFPFIGDEYEKERLHYSGRFFLQRTAQQLCQGLGRTRRGRPQDYGEENGFVAVADGSVNRVLAYVSEDVREAVIS